MILGETKNFLTELIKVSESTPNVLDANGIIIATFLSMAEPSELTDYFKSNKRNFLIFDLNPENSGVNITKPDIHKGLFGFLEEMDKDKLEMMTNSLMDEITSIDISMSAGTKQTKSLKSKPEITIEEKLENALKIEDYHLAAKLRDEIKKLNKKNRKGQ